MKLSKSWTTVTPLSKIIALILFIALPFFGFYLGLHAQQSISPAAIITPFEPDPFSVYISSVSPSTAEIGNTVQIGGTGFTSENYIHISSGYTKAISSSDGKTLLFTIPSTVEGGCYTPPVISSGHKLQCLAIANMPINAGDISFTVVNKNGESNTMKIQIKK